MTERQANPSNMKLVRTQTSTTTFSRAYLERAWSDRARLNAMERRGFAVFFYMTITAHLEACIVEVISSRIDSSRWAIRHMPEQTGTLSDDSDAKGIALRPFHDALASLLRGIARRIEKAALDSLIDLFKEVFARDLVAVLGDGYQDLIALSRIRNVFAHGRQYVLHFGPEDENLLTLEGSPLEEAAKRLRGAGVIKSLAIEGTDHEEFTQTLFSDEALLYFLGRARMIEASLKAMVPFEAEHGPPLMVSLPELNA